MVGSLSDRGSTPLISTNRPQKNNAYYHYFKGGFGVTVWADEDRTIEIYRSIFHLIGFRVN